MAVYEDEQQPLCPCCKEGQEFHKLLEVKDTGLVVYCHRTCTEDITQSGAVGSAVNTSRDVFILHNKKEEKIKTSELVSELEKQDISCLRCRKTFEHAQELMKEITSIDGKIVMGICDHCRKKAQGSKKPFCTCDQIVNKFISVKGEQKDDIKKHVKIWLSKMGYLLKDSITFIKPKQIKTRTYSDLQINQDFKSPVSRHEPKYQQMFYPETHKSDMNLNTEMKETDFTEVFIKKSVAFFQPTEPMETSFAHAPHESMKISVKIPSVGSDTTFVEAYVGIEELPRTSLKDRKQEEIFEDTPSINAKEALKRKHDLSLRQMMRLEKDAGVPYSVSKRPDVYEIPKIAPWEQEEPTSKYHVESEMDKKAPTSAKTKHDVDHGSTHDLDYKSNRPVKPGLSETSQKRLEDRYFIDEKLKLQRSVDKFSHKTIKSKGWRKKVLEPKEYVRSVSKPQFSFLFPKKQNKQVIPEVTSSQLIKKTRDMVRLQAEKEKQRQEEERQLKLEQDQKKKLAREEKKVQAEEKKRQVVEDKKRLTEHKNYSKTGQSSPVGEEEKQDTKAKIDKSKVSSFQKDGESELKGKISKVSGVAKKDTGDKNDKILQEAKKDIKDTGDKNDQILQEAKKDIRDTGDKNKQILQEAKKYVKDTGHKNDKILQEAKKDIKDTGDKTDKILQEAKKDIKDSKKSDTIRKELDTTKKVEKGTPKLKEKGDDLISKAYQKVKRETRNKDDETTAKSKNGLKEISKNKDEVTEKGTKQKDKISASETAQKEVKAKSEQNDKGLENEQKKKTEKEIQDVKQKQKEDNEYKERLKQIAQLRKANEALKKQDAEKKRAELLKGEDVPSKKGKSTNKEGDSSKEVTVSLSKIQKSMTKEKEEISTIVSIKKQGGLKGKEGETKEISEGQSRKANEALKKQAAEKKRAELLKGGDVPSKKGKSTNKEGDSSKEVTVSLSKIQKSMIKQKEEISMIVSIMKQGGLKGKEGETKEISGKTSKPQTEIQKLHAERLKEKEQALKNKKQPENEAQEAKANQQAVRKENPLTVGNIKVIKSDHDQMLRLVQIKQAAAMQPYEVGVEVIREHELEHEISRNPFCPLCLNSELEIDVLSLENKKNHLKEKITDIIIGENIFKIKRNLKTTKEPEVIPKLFKKIFFHLPDSEIVQIIPQEVKPVEKQIISLSKKDPKGIEVESKGILRYALSDRTFIEKGWTMLPTEKIVRKMNVYRMRPAHPEFDWFEHNKNKRLMTYDSGERLAEFDDNGRGRWYYKNGRLALDYYDAEETNAQQRFVIYSSGEPDERGRTHPITILATFDYLGNGIVFDHAGKIRLKYNQTEGVVLDRGIGPVSHWKWHTLNDPPVLQQVMIDTQMAHKDPNILKLGTHADKKPRPDNEEMLAIEFDNFIKEKSKKLSQKFKPFQIKMKALKINEHFSLRVLDQATVYLIFRDGSTNLKLNIGMILDHQEIVDTDTAEVGEVSNSLERFPARTDSLAGLQRSVAHAQRYERQQTERERRLRPPEPCASADHLTAAVSPPLRLPLRTVPTGSSSSTGYCSRKPTNNLYYNTRLL